MESGSQKVLDIIKKDIKIEDVRKVFKLAKEAGIKSLMFVIVGTPGETPEDIRKTIKLIEEIKPDDVAFHLLSAWPGSEFREYLIKNNLLDNVDDYYRYGSNMEVSHHTKEMTAEEIKKYYRLLVLRYGHSRWHFIKFALKSLLTLDGWKKLLKRIRIVMEYSWGWAKINIKNKFNK